MIIEKQFEEFIEKLKEELIGNLAVGDAKGHIDNAIIDKLSKDIYSQGKKDNNEVQNDLLSGVTKYEEGKTINTEPMPLNTDNHSDTQKDIHSPQSVQEPDDALVEGETEEARIQSEIKRPGSLERENVATGKPAEDTSKKGKYLLKSPIIQYANGFKDGYEAGKEIVNQINYEEHLKEKEDDNRKTI